MPRKGLKREQVQPEIERQLADDVGVIISSGNNELMKIPNLSLMPGKTCPGEVAECKYCTAKGVLHYSTWSEVRWTVNTFYARNLIERFKMDVMCQIYLARPQYFRIHVGGDFFSQEYLDAWFAICRDRKDVRFLAFTKSFELDYSNKPENFQAIWSVFPSTDFNKVPKGPRAWTEFDEIKLYYPPGPTYNMAANAFRCVGGCESCGMCFYADQNRMDVRFQAHGSWNNSKWLTRDDKGRFLPKEVSHE
jgi:hypothetical protein